MTNRKHKIYKFLKKSISYIFLWGGFIFIFYMVFSMYLNLAQWEGNGLAKLVSCFPIVIAIALVYVIVNHLLCAKVISKKLITTAESLLALNIAIMLFNDFFWPFLFRL